MATLGSIENCVSQSGISGSDSHELPAADFERLGYFVSRRLLEMEPYLAVRCELLALAKYLIGAPQPDIDSAWEQLRTTDRRLGSLLYNAVKLLPSIHRIATSSRLIERLRLLGIEAPAIVDVNFRIDSHGEDRFLFGWHQDYWFSICSPAAIVAWIPLTDVRRDQNGGIELIPRDASQGRILKTRAGTAYNSYADAVVLDEPVPEGPFVSLDLEAGDVLLFRFDVLRRSLPVRSAGRARWTLQVRFADLHDSAFRGENYKPGVVTSSTSTYKERTK